MISTVIFDAVFRCENSQSTLDFAHGVFALSKTVVGSGAFGNIDGSLLAYETEFPTSFLCSTFLLALLDRGNAVFVLFTSSPLLGTFLFDALLKVSNGNSGFNIFLDFSCIEAIVVNDTLDIVGSIGALSFFEAILPA